MGSGVFSGHSQVSEELENKLKMKDLDIRKDVGEEKEKEKFFFWKHEWKDEC